MCSVCRTCRTSILHHADKIGNVDIVSELGESLKCIVSHTKKVSVGYFFKPSDRIGTSRMAECTDGLSAYRPHGGFAEPDENI